MTMKITSRAFSEGAPIPRQYTGDGADVSPPLQWTDVPEGTRCFALVCDDPDAPSGTWVHWVLYDLPAQSRDLPEGVPRQKDLASGARQGLNDFGKVGYGGPAPPRGRGAHRYFFRLYALDAATGLQAGARKQDLLKAIKGHVLAEAQLMGTYER